MAKQKQFVAQGCKKLSRNKAGLCKLAELNGLQFNKDIIDCQLLLI